MKVFVCYDPNEKVNILIRNNFSKEELFRTRENWIFNPFLLWSYNNSMTLHVFIYTSESRDQVKFDDFAFTFEDYNAGYTRIREAYLYIERKNNQDVKIRVNEDAKSNEGYETGSDYNDAQWSHMTNKCILDNDFYNFLIEICRDEHVDSENSSIDTDSENSTSDKGSKNSSTDEDSANSSTDEDSENNTTDTE